MTGPRSQKAPRGAGQLAALALVVLWYEIGCAAILRLLASLSWPAALWQGGLCVVASVPLLLLVLKAVQFPKLLWSARQASFAPRALLACVGAVVALAELLLPWLGWSAVIWLANAGRLSAGAAVGSGWAIGMFSYLTCLGLVLAFRPRPRDVQVTRLEIPIPELPAGFDGYQILHLSDFHKGLYLSAEGLVARLGAAVSIEPDLVVFTGDLADRGADHAEHAAGILAALPAGDGTVAVLGNHEYWVGEESITQSYSRYGVKVLTNSHLTRSRGGDTMYLAGVGDASYLNEDDLAAALDGIPTGAPIILLSHAPDIIRKPLSARASLILAGHTHGGQVVLPGIGPIYVPSRLGRAYASGLHRIDGRWLLINRGLGEVFPPLRINCPPEIILLTLRRAAPSPVELRPD